MTTSKCQRFEYTLYTIEDLPQKMAKWNFLSDRAPWPGTTAGDAFARMVAMYYPSGNRWTSCVDADRGLYCKERGNVLYRVTNLGDDQWRIQAVGTVRENYSPLT